ncbi:MAG: hypothetical protein HYY01_04605 [Chloroflexi bacterium]|nr:hypothetical protein [Chloroflexota bacterium]
MRRRAFLGASLGLALALIATSCRSSKPAATATSTPAGLPPTVTGTPARLPDFTQMGWSFGPAATPTSPAPGRAGAGDGPSQPRVVRVSPDKPAELEFAPGARLSAPAGAFDRATTLVARSRASQDFAEQSATGVLVSKVYDISFQDAPADLRGPVTLTLPYDTEKVPEGTQPHALRMAWWDGQAWQEMPSTVNVKDHTVSAKVQHFTGFGVYWSRFEDLVYDATGAIRGGAYDAEHLSDVFTIHYQTKPRTSTGVGTRLNINPKVEVLDERPPQKDDNRNGVPDYVETLGEALAHSRKVFEGGGVFGKMRLPVSGAIHVFVLDLGYNPATGAGVAGDVYNVTTHIRIDNKLNDGQLRNTAAHELFHYWQWSTLPILTGNKHFWWLEATSTWAMNQVYPELEHYYERIRALRPNPPLRGLADIQSRDKGEFYAAGSLAFYLEARFPGFIMATFDQANGLRLSEPWHATFNRLLHDRYGTGGLSPVFLDYMAAYYYHHDIHANMKDLWGFGGTAFYTDLSAPYAQVKQGFYQRFQESVPSLSGRLISLVAASGDLQKGTLVVRLRQADPSDALRILVLAGLSSGNQRLGVDLETTAFQRGRSPTAPVPVTGFGGPRTDARVSQVHLLVVNTQSNQQFDIDLEAYFLEAPQNVRSEPVGDKSVRISWDASQLPAELLRGYGIYVAGASQPLATAGPSATRVDISADKVRGSRLVVRLIDKHDLESPDSNPVAPAVAAPTVAVPSSVTFSGNPQLAQESVFGPVTLTVELRPGGTVSATSQNKEEQPQTYNGKVYCRAVYDWTYTWTGVVSEMKGGRFKAWILLTREGTLTVKRDRNVEAPRLHSCVDETQHFGKAPLLFKGGLADWQYQGTENWTFLAEGAVGEGLLDKKFFGEISFRSRNCHWGECNLKGPRLGGYGFWLSHP